MPRRAPTDFAQLKIRLRESLRREIEEAARTSDRSLNAEMIDRLECSLRADKHEEILVLLRLIRIDLLALRSGTAPDLATLLREAADTLATKAE